ncbi:MAG: hypothetical protein ACTSXT_06070 [Candidatus Helarchaeota archaeon]
MDYLRSRPSISKRIGDFKKARLKIELNSVKLRILSECQKNKRDIGFI